MNRQLFSLLLILSLAVSGCGSKSSPSSEKRSDEPQKVEEPPAPQKPTEVPSELKELFGIPEAVRKDLEGSNFGTKDAPLWGKAHWIYYLKPWQKNQDNWFARVKYSIPQKDKDSIHKELLVWCHYHGKKLACHDELDDSKERLGEEPFDEDYPSDQPKDSGDDSCNDPLDCDGL